MKAILIGCLLALSLPGLRTDAATATEQPESFDAFLNLSQPYITNVSAYNPIFFLFGTHLADSKFQISFKYKLFEAVNGQDRWLDRVQLG